jgi:hypothetical protein
MQGHTAEQYNDEIRNLQTSTSQWYLSMLKEPPEPSDSDSSPSPEGPQAPREGHSGAGADKRQEPQRVDGLVRNACH